MTDALNHHRWQFTCFSSWDEIWCQPFLASWQGLLARGTDPHVFFTPPLVRAWCDTYRPLARLEPRFFWARSDRGLEVFLPMVLRTQSWRQGGQRSLIPVGQGEFDYCDPIATIRDEGEWQLFWDAFEQELAQRWQSQYDQVELGGLTAKSAPESRRKVESDIAPCFGLSEDGTAAGFLESLGRSLRGDIRRQTRRIEELGTVTLKVYAPDELCAALEVLPTILSEHSRKWPLNYKAPGFHERLLREGLPAGIVHLSELRVDGTAVSWHLGFLYGATFYWYLPIYQPEFHPYSPGKLHLYLCACEAIRARARVFDLLRGDEEYKRQWSTDRPALYQLRWQGGRALAGLRRGFTTTVKPLLSTLLRRSARSDG